MINRQRQQKKTTKYGNVQKGQNTSGGVYFNACFLCLCRDFGCGLFEG